MASAKKGVSPLIATVLLIAFTMAIAGIMATWATTFSRERLGSASEDAECVGALDISTLSFSNGTISLKIKNVSPNINLTGLRASVEYSDATKNRAYTLKDYNVSDPLGSAAISFLIVNTNDPTKPKNIEIITANCPKHSAILNFR